MFGGGRVGPGIVVAEAKVGGAWFRDVVANETVISFRSAHKTFLIPLSRKAGILFGRRDVVVFMYIPGPHRVFRRVKSISAS